MNRAEKILDGVAAYAAYYRSNPHRFVKDYLHIELRLFQKIMIVMMNICTVVVFFGARGIGKTFLSAIFCVVRAILYPGSKICIASGVRSQSIIVLEKIMLELKPNSPELAAEIDERQTKINGTNAQIVFRNGSYIKVVTASDSARGNRATVLLLDEFRLIDKDIVDTVLRKFLTQKRMPRYAELSHKEADAEYQKEKNMTMYLSSAYWKDSWAYTKCVETASLMLDDHRRQFVCGLPYQLSIEEGLLDRDTVLDELGEQSYSDIKFSMEYECMFYGSDDDAFFDFDTISKNRRIKYPMLPAKLASKVSTNSLKIQPKLNGEKRLLSADIALMTSKKHMNDATAIFINQMLPTKAGRYTNNIVYTESCEGLRTEQQALIIRKLYEEFECDYIVLDTNGIGLGIYDALARDMVDPDTGEVYPALSCYNNNEMAARCTVPNADRVIWSIKASAQFNSDAAFLLREGFKSGRIRLLTSEYDAEEYLSELKGYSNLNPPERMQLQLPYINTTLLIDELVKLQHEESGGKVRVFERTGMRKDRYSSLSYNYYVATQLENKLTKRNNANMNASEMFVIKPPSYTGKAASMKNARERHSTWF